MYYLLETNYFVQPGPYRTRPIKPPFGYAPSYWLRGRSMTPPQDPIQVQLWERGGDGMAELFLDSIPLFRDDLVTTLVECGVDNIQTFPATLFLPKGTLVHDYKAVNILGAVKCADLLRSKYDDITGTGLIAMSFQQLTIDATVAADNLFFRLAEAVSSIIVHEQTKTRIDTKGFRYLHWRPLVEDQ